MHKQQRRRRCDQPERRKVLARIVTGIAENIWTGRHCGGVTEKDRVTVGRGACDFARSHCAAAAGVAIFNDDPLPERLAHFIGDRTGHDIGGAAGRQRDDENNGAVRIVVGGFSYRGEESSRRYNPSQRCYACKSLPHFPSSTFFLAAPAAASQ